MEQSKIVRILVTGSRDWTNYSQIARQLSIAISNFYETGFTNFVLVHGNCLTGADSMANEFWNITQNSFKARGIYLRNPEKHTASFYPNGVKFLAAGPIRNQKMVNLGADICLAFIKNKSRGATGCSTMAEKAGINTLYFKE